jgi:hypothetical protein
MEPVELNFPLRMPARPGFREVIWGMDSVVAVTESPFTFKQQTISWPGQRWKCGLRLPPMKLDLAREWFGFFASLNGQEGTFLLSDSAFARRQIGDGLGNPETDGAQTTGRAITTKGWTPLIQVGRSGDWLELAGRLRRVIAPAWSGADGKAKMLIWPHIGALEPDVHIEWLRPTGIFRLTSEIETTWDIQRMMAGLQFSCVEAL